MYSIYFKELLNSDNYKKEIVQKKTKEKKQSELKFLKLKLKEKKQKLIPNTIIQIFYDKPQIFFNNYKTYLKNTSYFDNCGFSIFIHYFYILFENKEKDKEIYIKNFSQFFTDYKDALIIQDYFLDTPLHKLAKMRNKKYFLEICDKFNEIGILIEKSLNIKNCEDFTCLDYIVQDINIHFVSLIKKNEYMKFKNYKLIIDYYLNITDNEYEKFMLKCFEDGFYYVKEKFKEIQFEKFYGDIIYGINNKKENIYNFISFLAERGINLINFLFELCEKGDDFDKVFILVKKYLIEKKELEKYIYEHTSYVLRKMNSTNKRGNNEIKYGINLLKFILDEKIKKKDEKEIITILLFRKIITKKNKISKNIFKEGIIYNIIYNPNLDFKKKCEIFLLFKNLNNFDFILKELSNEEFIQFYNFLEFIENNDVNKKNILNIYNTKDNFKNIFSKFIDYKNYYQIIIELCEEPNNKKYYDEFVKLANEILIKKFPVYLKYYLSNSEKQINKILKLVLLFSEQDFKLNSNNIYNYDLINHFLINEKFTLCYLKKILNHSFENDYAYFFEIIFNSEFYLGEFIKEYNKEIKIALDKINLEENIKNIKITKKLNLENISQLMSLLEEYPLEYILKTNNKELYTEKINNKTPIKYFNAFLFFADIFKDLNFLSQTKSNIIYDIKLMIKHNLLFFLNDWDKSFDFNKFINLVENNILVFCKLLIIDNSLKEENCLKINFFFEFLYELKPELKQKFSDYQTMVLTYINNNNKNSEYIGFIDQNVILNYYLMLILMYIKFKYGDYNPEILFIFLDYYEQYNNKIFLLFLKCVKENNNYKIIFNHFFIGNFASNKKNLSHLNKELKSNIRQIYRKNSIYFLLDNIIFFFNNYLNDLNEIKYSLVYDYIISVLTELGKYNKEKECLIPYIMINIGQNEKIINIILGKITSYEINFYDFIKVEYNTKNENNFRKFIYNFIQTNKKINSKTKLIFPSKSNNFYLYRDIYYFPKEYLIKNVSQFFSMLKKKSINLYDCVCKHSSFIRQTFNLFIILLYKYNILKGKNNKESDDKNISFIGDEIYEFILKFINSNIKSKKSILLTLWEIDTRKIFLKIFHDRILRINDKNKINYEFDKLIELLDYYIGNEKKSEIYNNFGKDLKEILKHAIEKDAENCCKFMDYILKYFEFKINRVQSLCHYLILKVMVNNIKKNMKYLIFFLTLIKDTFSFNENYNLQKNNFLINYYLKDTEFNNKTNVFHKILLQSMSKLDIQSLKNYIRRLIVEITDKNICSYLLVQIRQINLFQKEEEFLLFILNNGIPNKFFFDYLFNFLNSERKKNFFELNKMEIIKSLFLYGQNNEYYFLEKLLEFISNYMTKQDIREIVYPLKGIEEDIKKSVNYLQINFDDNNYFNPREKFLFIYCLNKKIKKNYETIALLFNYCPKTFAIFELCPFLNEIVNKKNLEEFPIKIFDYLNYFKTNKNLIKKISNDFYEFSLFLELFQNTYYNLKDFEKNIFLFYIQIFILETVPKELLVLFRQMFGDVLQKELPECEKWFLDELNKRGKYEFIPEKIIFIILSLYEIKRSPLLPIKKYLPEFNDKIEQFVKKYKNLNIPSLCLKKPFDINFIDKFKYIIETKPEKILDYLYKKNPMFNLIFIIEKEKNLLMNFDINKNYLAKVLYLLLANNNSLKPENLDDKNFLKALKCELGTESIDCGTMFNNTRINTDSFGFFDEYIDNSKYPDDIIKNCILTLDNFDHYTAILLENCWNNIIIFKYDFLREFRNYLRILFTLSNYILSLKNKSFYNDYIPHVNVLNEAFFNQFNDKLKSLTKSMNVDRVYKNIIKYFHQKEEMDTFNLNKIQSNYFFVIENWLTLYMESPFIQKYFHDIQKEKFNYISFFKYLKIICLMLIKFLNLIDEIDYIKFKSMFSQNQELKIDNLFFKYEPNKENAKKILGESLFNLGKEIFDNLKDTKYNDFKTKIVFGYQYNNEINNFVETNTGIVLYDFFVNKIINLINYININRYEIQEYKKSLNIKKSRKKNKDNKKQNKEIPYRIFALFNKVLQEGKKEDINKCLMPYFCNYKDLNEILNLFDFSNYKNLFCNFLRNTSNEILQPDSRFYPYKIYKYFYDLYFSYIYPIYNFNILLSKFCNNEYDLCFMYGSYIYKKYESFIDFYELVKAIFNTEFNKNDDLNTSFKKELISFLLESQNSLLYIFIHEVYNLIKKEIVDRRDKKLKIKNKFKIKVQQGFKYSKQFISKLKEDLNSNKNIIVKIKNNINNDTNDQSKEDNEIKLNKEEKKENLEENNTNTINTINNNNNTLPSKKKKFKLKLNPKKEETNNPNLISDTNIKNSTDSNKGVIVVKNFFKRKIIPIKGYSGFVPHSTNLIGKSKLNHMKNIFNNEIIFLNKTEYKETIKPEKQNKKKINILNLIFRISSLTKDEIVLNQYDITEILDKNLDKDNLKKMIRENICIAPDIPKYWSKHLNLAFIYGQLKFNFFDKPSEK